MAAANSGSVGRGRIMSDFQVRHWDGEEWPEKRVSIADHDGKAIAISPRYADDETIKQMEFLSTAPTLAAKVAELEEERKQLRDRLDAIGRVTICEDIHAMARGQADEKVQAIIRGF